MGWNDRIPDDPPYIPYDSPTDRDDYENWQMYLEYCQQHPEELGGLSSQNIDPASLPQIMAGRPAADLSLAPAREGAQSTEGSQRPQPLPLLPPASQP